HARKEGKRHTLFDHAEHNGCYQTLWNRGGPQNLGGFTVYSTLEPCVMCMSMLMTVRVSRIVWAEDDPAGGGSFMFRHPDELPGRFKAERPALHRGVLQEESRALLRRFFEPKIGGGGHWSDPNNALVRLVMGE
ncbi:hypothetical protein KGO04_03190, partial [Patescibacteria group bacterium]|nr:hypothetical protein [Patescibacteria group bacterium]